MIAVDALCACARACVCVRVCAKATNPNHAPTAGYRCMFACECGCGCPKSRKNGLICLPTHRPSHTNAWQKKKAESILKQPRSSSETPMPCPALPCPAIRCHPLDCPAFQESALHYSALPWVALANLFSCHEDEQSPASTIVGSTRLCVCGLCSIQLHLDLGCQWYMMPMMAGFN